MRHGLWATSNQPITSGGIVESDAVPVATVVRCVRV